ncbi:MAG: CBS domain-containing protein [Phycisphaerae bacterium]
MSHTPRIRKLLTHKHDCVITTVDTHTVGQAAKKMTKYHVGCVMVEEESGKLVGILSERDVLMKVVGVGLDPRKTLVGEVMTREMVHCDRETCIAHAQQMMAKHEIRHLPIVEDGKAVGMISSRDILAHQQSTVEDIARIQSTVLDRLQRLFPGISDMEDQEVEKVAH